MIGTLDRLYCYPVKSLLGEPVTATEVTAQGLVHDRRFALLDTETGKVASAKHPRLRRRLLLLTAELSDAAVQITAPDGTTWHSTDSDTDDHLSRFIGRGVPLTDTPPADATVDRARPDDLLRGILSELSSILEAAVDDKRLASNPMHAKSVRWPKATQERREAWLLGTALRVRDVISPRNRITVVLGLGCGLRQGEVFGLSPDDIDYARGVLHVRRQVQAIKGRLYFALPKGKKTRVVDMPPSVAEELKRHVEVFPPVEVELPWGKPEGQRRKFSLLLTTRFGNAIAVNTWNTYTWKPALAKAGIIPPRAKGAKKWQWEAAPKDGSHVLRHTYASIILEAGESVVTLARWLGHSSPAITLGYYAHFMPETGSKGRTAIDGLLGRQGDLHAIRNSPDSPQG
ncbi:MOSC N-terminal beta barrel domain-containing protein [Streptomyces prunicolor]|uniref:MOSC N-terminal beta barrel domain-containing protein n=1 Tax=Streptomyces prunicolor TaxID=67348 RepID=UPI003414229F